MGIRMDDLHTPTVPSGPTTGQQTNGVNKDELSLLQLINEKERVESELKALGSVLDSHGVNMNTGLTTFDGFPRSDIDVPQIRTTRARIIYLRNDYKDLMNRIETGLHAHYANAASNPPASASIANRTVPVTAAGTQQRGIGVAFAKVNSVAPDSPAHQAGLQAGDQIITFGSVDWTNHEKLSKVAEVVSNNEGRPLQVKLSRLGTANTAPDEITVSLTPKRDWGGRGLLGCHLLPF